MCVETSAAERVRHFGLVGGIVRQHTDQSIGELVHTLAIALYDEMRAGRTFPNPEEDIPQQLQGLMENALGHADGMHLWTLIEEQRRL